MLALGVGTEFIVNFMAYGEVLAAAHNVHFAIFFSSFNSKLDCVRIGTRSFSRARSASSRWVPDHMTK